METWMWVAIAAGVAVVAIVVLAAIFSMKRRSSHRRRDELKEQFGPEYDHTVSEKGQREGEADLLAREQRSSRLGLRSLSVGEATRFSSSWSTIQAHFADYPTEAVLQADRLVAELLESRGYPSLDFEERVSMVSVEHPRAAAEYRAARDIALRGERNGVSTEELRHSLLRYRAVFHEMAEVGAANRADHSNGVEPTGDEVEAAETADIHRA